MLEQERRRITRISQEGNASQMAGMGKGKGKKGFGSFGSKGKGKGYSDNKPLSKAFGKGKGTPGANLCREPGCLTRHSDVATCPGILAKKDPKYRSGDGKCDHMIYGKYKCDSCNHWRRHHVEQLEAERGSAGGGPSFGGKSKGKGKKGGYLSSGYAYGEEHNEGYWQEYAEPNEPDSYEWTEGAWGAESQWSYSAAGSTESWPADVPQPWVPDDQPGDEWAAHRDLYQAFAQKSNETLEGVIRELRRVQPPPPHATSSGEQQQQAA